MKSGCDGLITLKEMGTTLSQSDADWTGFSALGQVSIGYDSIDREVKLATSNAGTYQASRSMATM